MMPTCGTGFFPVPLRPVLLIFLQKYVRKSTGHESTIPDGKIILPETVFFWPPDF
jgi:hypothetical protein